MVTLWIILDHLQENIWAAHWSYLTQRCYCWWLLKQANTHCCSSILSVWYPTGSWCKDWRTAPMCSVLLVMWTQKAAFWLLCTGQTIHTHHCSGPFTFCVVISTCVGAKYSHEAIHFSMCGAEVTTVLIVLKCTWAQQHAQCQGASALLCVVEKRKTRTHTQLPAVPCKHTTTQTVHNYVCQLHTSRKTKHMTERNRTLMVRRQTTFDFIQCYQIKLWPPSTIHRMSIMQNCHSGNSLIHTSCWFHIIWILTERSETSSTPLFQAS